MESSHIQMFYNMMQDCYGVWGWEYSPDLELQDTNCPSPNLYKALLLGQGRDEAIWDHARKSDVPMIITDSMGLMWAAVEQKTEKPENVGAFFVLGPIINNEVSTQTLEAVLAPFDMSMKNKWDLIGELTRLPRVSTVVFFQQVIMLHYYVNGQKVRVSGFDYYTPRQEASVHKKMDLRDDVPHATPLTEKKLLDMIRTGNLEYQSAMEEAGAVSPGIRVRNAEPINQAKYSVVAFITLCTRAAIEGGLSSEVAYTLSDTYTQSVDEAKTISHVAAVSHTMYDDFVRRVNQVRREQGVSRPVRICCDYIDTHPERELSLKFLAEKVGYTENYLARKFKAEMGMPINAYIRKARVHRAKMLLSSTNLSIQEIADYLHFCSRSYFTKAFLEEEGITPTHFRNKL